MSRPAALNKGTPPMVGRGRKTAAKIPVRNHVGSSQSSTFPFRRNGFDHKLSEQIGRVCLVARTKRDRQLHYEVVVFQKRKARIFSNGDFLPEGWVYPAGGRWGEAGWTYGDLAGARCHYLTLARKQGVEGAGSMNIAGTQEHAPHVERRAAHEPSAWLTSWVSAPEKPARGLSPPTLAGTA